MGRRQAGRLRQRHPAAGARGRPGRAHGLLDRADLPFYYGLARTFPLADRWFSSCLGPTFPNRRFLISGTANGLIDDLPVNLADYPAGGTIFDQLTRHGISWVNYHPLAGGKTTLGRSRHGRAVRHRAKAVRRRLRTLRVLRPSALAGLGKDMQFTADIYPLGIARYMLHVRGTDDFFRDAEAGTLPAFSLVDPDFKAYSEENPQDIQKGESFASAVINAVMDGKGWMNTLLIWVYDEHGGYYDHVPPPPAVPPDDVPGRSVTASRTAMGWLLRTLAPGYVRHAQQLDAGPQSYDRYGFRVPAVLVSPYARPGYVTSETYDHTSILKLVEEKWNLPALTERDAAARSPLDALDFDARRPSRSRRRCPGPRCAGAPGPRRSEPPEPREQETFERDTPRWLSPCRKSARPWPSWADCASGRCAWKTRCTTSCGPPMRSSTWTGPG